MSLSDRRGMEKVTLNPEKSEAIDALSKDLNNDFLKEKLSQKTAAIKSILLDQHFIKGIGNAYADEILWEAKISPFSMGKKIPENKIQDLIESIKNVLSHAAQHIKDKYPEITFGEVRDFLVIHNPDKKESPSGVSIKTKKLALEKHTILKNSIYIARLWQKKGRFI